MKRRRSFKFYSDPGHGWLRVTLVSLQRLGLRGSISRYSYMRGKYAYLEEDCDAPLFLDAVKKAGYEYVLQHSHTDKTSRIRGYAGYGVGGVHG